VVKRVVKRTRHDDDSVLVLVGTPSRLSFPSAHATSTTAAAVLYGGLTGRRLSPLLVPPMLVSRMVLGVHYPSDVVAGSVLGAAIGGLVRHKLNRRKERDEQGRSSG
jgi:membrane-associated phospholipid phosphatase